MKKILGVLSFILIFGACTESDDTSIDTGGGPDTSAFDRAAMLENWADNIIIPGYQDFAQKLANMETATGTFTNDPNASNLEQLRNAWAAAYSTWQRVSMFEIGPAEQLNLRLNLNIYPTSVAIISGNISGGSYDLGLSSNRAAKGFPAIDYLLYGIGATVEDVVAVYNGPDGVAHRQYLEDVVMDITTLTAQTLAAWQGDYRATFVDNDGASATASTDRFVNDFIFYFEKHLRAGKMGIPGGVFSGNVVPENEEAFYAGGTLSKELFLTGLQASQDFFNGKAYNSSTQGESLNSYLNELNTVKDGADLSAIINDQFDTARLAVQSLGTFSEELQNNPPTAFLEAYNEVQRLVPLFKVDMVSAMSISIDFTDADGD